VVHRHWLKTQSEHGAHRGSFGGRVAVDHRDEARPERHPNKVALGPGSRPAPSSPARNPWRRHAVAHHRISGTEGRSRHREQRGPARRCTVLTFSSPLEDGSFLPH